MLSNTMFSSVANRQFMELRMSNQELHKELQRGFRNPGSAQAVGFPYDHLKRVGFLPLPLPGQRLSELAS